MEIIRELVRNIAIIVVITSLLELLLPVSNMQRFIKVVMGLFVIVTILNPVLGLVKKQVAFEVTNPAGNSQGQLTSILEKGKAISQASQEQAIAQYEAKLSQQVMAVAQMVPGVKLQQVKVKVNGQKAGSQGEINEIKLIIDQGKKGEPGETGTKEAIPRVEPVKIDAAEGGGRAEATLARQDNTLDEKTRTKLIDTIANFYSIKPQMIKISSDQP